MAKNFEKTLRIDRRDFFIRQYLIHFNATRAYREAGYKEGSGIHQSASNLLRSPYVQQQLGELRRQVLEKLDVTIEVVLAHYKAIAFGDISEIAQLRVTPCRYCWGENHAFQWRTRREWNAACETARARNFPEPKCDGGFGYTRNSCPNARCPECDGDGQPRVCLLYTSPSPRD